MKSLLSIVLFLSGLIAQASFVESNYLYGVKKRVMATPVAFSEIEISYQAIDHGSFIDVDKMVASVIKNYNTKVIVERVDLLKSNRLKDTLEILDRLFEFEHFYLIGIESYFYLIVCNIKVFLFNAIISNFRTEIKHLVNLKCSRFINRI